MRNLRVAGFILSFLVVTAFASTAFAQKIRTYNADAEQTYGTSTNTTATDMASGQTGATSVTVNAQGQPQQGQQAAAGGEDGEMEIEPSYVTVFSPGGAQGALPINLTPDKMYSGIIPGTRDEVTHFTEARQKGENSSNANRILWVGFDAREDKTRVFFQTARDAEYEVGEQDGLVTVTFRNTQVAAYNFRRFIDASFFNRNVERIEMEKVGRNQVIARIKLRQYERPNVDRSGNYLYLDFSNGTSQAANTEE